MINLRGGFSLYLLTFRGVFYHDTFTTLLRQLYEKTVYFCEICFRYRILKSAIFEQKETRNPLYIKELRTSQAWQGQKDLNPRHAVLEFFQKRIIVHYAVLRSVIFVYYVLHIILFRKNKALLNDIFKKSIRQVLDRVLDKIQPSCTRFTEHKFRGLKTKESDNHSIKSRADH